MIFAGFMIVMWNVGNESRGVWCWIIILINWELLCPGFHVKFMSDKGLIELDKKIGGNIISNWELVPGLETLDITGK